MILGIDLGTSNSMAAVYKEGRPIIIESRTGKKAIPSFVSVDEKGNFFAGDVAKERAIPYPEQTVGNFKRGMGTEKMFSIGGKELKAVELSAIVLRNIKADAEKFLGEEIKEAVISVPAFFSNPQRKAVLQAGELAGFQVRQIVNEPTAAAMAYGAREEASKENTGETNVLMVMDLGGGTFDISIVEQTDDIMEVVAVCGDNHLGGEDFTRLLMKLFLEANGIQEPLKQGEEMALWKQAEQAKRMFAIFGTGKMHGEIEGKSYVYEISEQDYEKECFPLLERIRKLALKSVEESKYEMQDISEILMVGGGLKLSVIQNMIIKLMGKQLEYKLDPDEAVAQGAALAGHLLEQQHGVKDLIMTDVCPYDLGCYVNERQGYDFQQQFEVLIKKNTTIPAKRVKYSSVEGKPGKRVFSLLQKTEGYANEAVALGKIYYRIPAIKGGNCHSAAESGKCHIERTIIYDVNGIVKVEIYIHENDLRKEMYVLNENCELTMEEARKRMEELEYLKASPLEEEDNRLLAARAERMYAECTGKEREQINLYLKQFENAMNSYDEERIAAAREQLKYLLDSIEEIFY